MYRWLVTQRDFALWLWFYNHFLFSRLYLPDFLFYLCVWCEKICYFRLCSIVAFLCYVLILSFVPFLNSFRANPSKLAVKARSSPSYYFINWDLRQNFLAGFVDAIVTTSFDLPWRQTESSGSSFCDTLFIHPTGSQLEVDRHHPRSRKYLFNVEIWEKQLDFLYAIIEGSVRSLYTFNSM